jgi:hypothetical protein
MVNHTIHSSGKNRWSKPQQSLDPNTRRIVYGPIRPMEDRGFLWRLLHRG